MAPLRRVQSGFDDDLGNTEGSLEYNTVTPFAIYGFASLICLMLLAGICGCCGKKGKRRDDDHGTEPPPPVNVEDTVPGQTVQSKAKSKADRSTRSPTGKTRKGKDEERSTKDKSKRESEAKPPEAEPPRYMDVGPPAAEEKPPENAGPRYWEIAPVENPKKKKPELDHAPSREPAYRTLYGIGDDFQASNREKNVGKDKPGTAASLQTDKGTGLAPPPHSTPKLRYLSIAPDLMPDKKRRSSPDEATASRGVGSQYTAKPAGTQRSRGYR